MNEEQIQAELKKNIPVESKPAETPPYPEPEVGDPTEHDNLPLDNFILKQEVSEFLDLPRGYKNNPEMVTQLDTVLAWAQDLAGTHEVADIVHVLARRQNEMGLRGKPDKLLRIYQYVKISKQIDGLYDRQRALYG